MRYPDSSAPYCNYGTVIQCLAVTADYCGNQYDSLLRRNVGQAHQSGVRDVVQVNEFPKVSVDRNQDPVSRFRNFQQGPVPGIRAERSSFEHVMSIVAQPFCQAASSAAVHQKPHGSATETEASVSPAMTAWA